MKYYEISILLIFLMITGIFSGIYATNVTHDNSKTSAINNTNNATKTLYVSLNGTDRNDGLTPNKPKRNIEKAIEAAKPGDTIKLAPGTYTHRVIIDKNIILSGTNQNNTIICMNHTNNGIIVVNGVTTTVSNLTIKNGSDSTHGGGIECHGVLTIENSSITNNNAPWGGGINSDGILLIRNCNINNNTGSVGGGIKSWGSLTIENSVIANNTSKDLGGGGITIIGGTLIIKDSSIINNTSKNNGGGIYASSNTIIYDSYISNNTAKENGGGIYNEGSLTVYGSKIIYNVAKSGGGIYNSLTTYLDDTTVSFLSNKPDNLAGHPYIPA